MEGKECSYWLVSSSRLSSFPVAAPSSVVLSLEKHARAVGQEADETQQVATSRDSCVIDHASPPHPSLRTCEEAGNKTRER